MVRVVSGIQPTGAPHLGNWFGAMEAHVALSRQLGPGDAGFFFVADLHALTTADDPEALAADVRGVAAAYLALGLDTTHASLYRQSDVPEVTELAWILATSTGLGVLQRAHAFKDQIARGHRPSVGLFTYPVLMAADVLGVEADRVVVGEDQAQHVEMARAMARGTNGRFPGARLALPELELGRAPKVPGLDGRKMSKSLGNTIPIFAPPDELRRRVAAIVTDSRPSSEPKDPDQIALVQLLMLFLDEGERADLRARVSVGGPAGPGYGELKQALLARIDATFQRARRRYEALLAGDDVERTLQGGAARARPVVRAVVARCYEACGLGHTAARLR